MGKDKEVKPSCGQDVERPYFYDLLQEIRSMRMENAILREELEKANLRISQMSENELEDEANV
jgi:hypothetical protein